MLFEARDVASNRFDVIACAGPVPTCRSPFLGAPQAWSSRWEPCEIVTRDRILHPPLAHAVDRPHFGERGGIASFVPCTTRLRSCGEERSGTLALRDHIDDPVSDNGMSFDVHATALCIGKTRQLHDRALAFTPSTRRACPAVLLPKLPE